jgi:uncharacterized protein with PQ loop repeat
MIDIIGWVGGFFFAACAFPQALQSYRQKHSDGLSWLFLWMWLMGEILTIIYVFPKTDVAPLLTNYFLNIVFLLVIIWFRFFPKRP